MDLGITDGFSIQKQYEEIGMAIVFSASEGLENGLDKAAAVLCQALKARSPRSTGKYAKGWIIKSLPGHRYVGNKTTVKGAKDDKIPLSLILEYGTPKMPAQPHVREAYDAAERELLDILESEISESL